MITSSTKLLTGGAIAWLCFAASCSIVQASGLLTGQAAFTDFTQQAPGVSRKLTKNDLPKPYMTESAHNGPHIVKRPDNAWPKCPAGFKVDLYARNLKNPRLIRVAPNGDLFLAESAPGRIKVLRGITSEGGASEVHVFADRLRQPFGIAFYPPGPNPNWVYVLDFGQREKVTSVYAAEIWRHKLLQRRYLRLALQQFAAQQRNDIAGSTGQAIEPLEHDRVD